MKRWLVACGSTAIGSCVLLLPAFAATPPSRHGVDAPQLAPLGEFAVGYKVLRLVQPEQVNPLAPTATGGYVKQDRVLQVDLWYPAKTAGNATPVTYSATLPSEPPARPAAFTVPGVAVAGAPAEGRDHPLVIVSHGYSNATIALSWLTENLASKGYVVAAIRHEDPPITDRTQYSQVLLRRPLDIAFVARTLRVTLAAEHLIDASNVALVGYSMGGYGVLTAGGAPLDPAAGPAKIVPGGLLLPYARGGAAIDAATVPGVRAIVAISPAGGAMASWGTDGLGVLRAPLLLISGDQDHTVNYRSGARAFFDAASGTHRYLLTLQGCGHAVGLNPVPEEMRNKLWDQDWFEDPVWRKDRINAVTTHFITAFLDRYLKADESRAAFLDVAVTESNDGEWPAGGTVAYDAYSPGTGGITVWKGFQRNHATGMQLLRADARTAVAADRAVAGRSPPNP